MQPAPPLDEPAAPAQAVPGLLSKLGLVAAGPWEQRNVWHHAWCGMLQGALWGYIAGTTHAYLQAQGSMGFSFDKAFPVFRKSVGTAAASLALGTGVWTVLDAKLMRDFPGAETTFPWHLVTMYGAAGGLAASVPFSVSMAPPLALVRAWLEEVTDVGGKAPPLPAQKAAQLHSQVVRGAQRVCLSTLGFSLIWAALFPLVRGELLRDPFGRLVGDE